MEEQKSTSPPHQSSRWYLSKKPLIWQFVIFFVWILAVSLMVYYLSYQSEIQDMIKVGILPIVNDYLVYIAIGLTLLGFLLLLLIPNRVQ